LYDESASFAKAAWQVMLATAMCNNDELHSHNGYIKN